MHRCQSLIPIGIKQENGPRKNKNEKLRIKILKKNFNLHTILKPEEMKKYKTVLILSLIAVNSLFCGLPTEKIDKPNIIIIYADDLGFGDISSYGATEIHTPNIDKIAEEGIKFTNGYATSATCTPSRFSLLAGEYPWRGKGRKILPGDAPILFDTTKQTLPSMLKGAGYKTGIVGKWHLGLGDGNINWNGEIAPGPNEIGFDYSYIMAATNDRVPSVYVKNHNVVGLNPEDPIEINYKTNFPGEATGADNPELLKVLPSHGHDKSIINGISRIGYMRGGKSALWTDENMADTFLVQSKNFIAENKDRSFFLYYALHQPHVPRVPHPRFAGKSGMGARGDVILEADWCVGELLKTLDIYGLAENTIVIFSSDNGPVLDDGYQDRAIEKLGKHKPAGPLRGGKYSLYDAGTHVPFMLRWSAVVKPGISDALVCQMDLLASFAQLTGQPNKRPDSQNILAALLGESLEGRESLILTGSGKKLIRKGDWIMIPPGKGKKIRAYIEVGVSDNYALYNVKNDPGQINNLASDFPEKIKELKLNLKKIMEN
jgi:arylsulfatase A-like enzyme